jgi:hypothetical protein
VRKVADRASFYSYCHDWLSIANHQFYSAGLSANDPSASKVVAVAQKSKKKKVGRRIKITNTHLAGIDLSKEFKKD